MISSEDFPSLMLAAIMRRRSREVMRPTTLPRSREESEVVSSRSTTIMPESLRSIQVKMAWRTVEDLGMTGSTQRIVCLAFRTSEIFT